MINLLPYKEKKTIERIRNIRIIQAVVLGLAVLSVISIVLLVPTFITINSRFAIATTQIKTLERDGTITTDVDLTTLEGRARSVKEKLATTVTVGPIEHIAIVRSLVPQGITIDRFASEDKTILEVYGTAQTREVLQGFISALQADIRISLVDSPVSNFIKNKNGTFKLSISFK